MINVKNCVIIDIEKYDDMVNGLKEYSKLSKEYDKRVFEKMELIDTIRNKDEEIERLKITIKNILSNIVNDDVLKYSKKVMSYDIRENIVEYLNDNFIDLIKEIRGIND